MRLDCHELGYTYPESETPVFRHLSFFMENPGFNAIFGPSGVGKTSLAKILAGMVLPSEGRVSRSGLDRVLYSYNLERLPGWSSVGRHLEKVSPPEKVSLQQELVRIFDLEAVLDSRFSMLSMGQQNRINLIRYLLQDFDLLVMDESLANVDEKLREKILVSVKELFRDKMFLYISHNLMEVSKFCSRILMFQRSGDGGRCFMVQGQDFQKGDLLDREKMDRTMLEMMNAF